MSIHITDKAKCFGCEACAQSCGRNAISMQEDNEGFRYPVINHDLCIECRACEKICQRNGIPPKNQEKKYVFGGYSLDDNLRFESTSGGAFSEIVNAFCDENYVIFGAEASGLDVIHSFITNKSELSKYRKSKYSQSKLGNSYKDASRFLKEGKKVLFSGTPCQIAGLKNYLGNTNQSHLLTVEVICEGVPSPLFVRKLDHHIEEKYGSKIALIDYRYKGKTIFSKGKWDFQQMAISTAHGKIIRPKDRWFNPFWSIWLKHIMSRPSCYQCPFSDCNRIADITLGDLWGVHLYCPELYGRNVGSSLMIGNTNKGKDVIKQAEKRMYGHELDFKDALKYQGPMRGHIPENPQRVEFMADLQSGMNYKQITKKWADRPTLKLLIQKYLWGNRQKVWLWNIKNTKS